MYTQAASGICQPALTYHKHVVHMHYIIISGVRSVTELVVCIRVKCCNVPLTQGMKQLNSHSWSVKNPEQ